MRRERTGTGGETAEVGRACPHQQPFGDSVSLWILVKTRRPKRIDNIRESTCTVEWGESHFFFWPGR